ncbi:MAG: metal-dependent transcriptional regulator [Spirochaetales bacterium]|nr:metal-dependent transcriptional regulator [Spirochaetales bacterium]
MAEQKQLTTSLEDYLEAILLLERKNRVARVKDIACLLQVQMPSVTGALRSLRDKELVNYKKNSFISLTDKGMEIAKDILTRHSIIRKFLERILLLPAGIADEQACKIEHLIDGMTLRRLYNTCRFLQNQLINKEIYSEEEWLKIIDEEVEYPSYPEEEFKND